MNKETLKRITLLRRELHQYPELSGQEKNTAKKIKSYFAPLKPDKTLSNIGGEGLAFVFEGKEKGPTTLIRCELDGLPIEENSGTPYQSNVPGLSHACGHDGHMAIVCGVGEDLANNRPLKGKIILLFQPAEETGEGAAQVLKSKAFSTIRPDYAFALHNLPGYNKNEIILKKGPFSAASIGMEIHLKGRTSHAAYPEEGNSPAEAMCKIIIGLQKLPESLAAFSQITVINAVLGEVSFGTTPGSATIRATLRTYENDALQTLIDYSEKLVKEIADEYGLKTDFDYMERFGVTNNHLDSWALVNSAAKKLNYKVRHIRTPFRWSEDFGEFSKVTNTTLFGLGAGKKSPTLHDTAYDFPDEIILTGINMFKNIVEKTNY